jgi:hypothetical protein
MSAKLHRSNTNFQIAYFIAGRCHTADAAYIELLNLREDREAALNMAKSYAVRRQATKMKIELRLAHPDPIEQIEGQADLIEFEFANEQHQQLKQAAEDELKFINECIDKINPFREYKDLTDHEAAEACQRKEWMLELKNRAENFLLTQGSIPTNEFDTMRQHPDVQKTLLPHIEQTQLALTNPGGHKLFLDLPTEFNFPKLIGLEGEQK